VARRAADAPVKKSSLPLLVIEDDLRLRLLRDLTAQLLLQRRRLRARQVLDSPN
jgi:hypothetical protein